MNGGCLGPRGGLSRLRVGAVWAASGGERSASPRLQGAGTEGARDPDEALREPTVWVLADDRAGNVSQALGVAEALGWDFSVKKIAYTGWARLPNFLRGASLFGLDKASRLELDEPPWPDLVISAGRRTAPAARWIKRRNGGKTFLCQIMWPGARGCSDFDLIAVPGHDSLRSERENVLRVTGAPHRVTTARLAVEGARWSARLSGIPRPMIALVVGGSTKNKTFTQEMARDLGQKVASVMQSAEASLVVTTSRRTGQEAERALFASLPTPAHAYRWGDKGENPYFGYLALADVVIVTGDSVSMVSEACATHGPVYVYAPEALVSAKHARLHQTLYALGMAKPLGDGFQVWKHPPLNAADDIAAKIRHALMPEDEAGE